ncbi:MAG: hypothetical protein MUF13_03735, partial [Akkermansiaceae bacterium]|nr:hypothetical protein [Akkermansiaceae bacterium]
LSVVRLAETCKITLTPHAAANYRIEWSDDLLIWENLEQRVISSAGEVEFIDPSPPPDRRFYRAATSH